MIQQGDNPVDVGNGSTPLVSRDWKPSLMREMWEHVRLYGYKAHLRHSLAVFLSEQPWDCFVTLTFNRRRNDAFEVRNAMRVWLERVYFRIANHRGLAQVEDVPGRDGVTYRKWSGPFVNSWKHRRAGSRPTYVLGVETHPESGGLHCHMVLRHPAMLGACPYLPFWDTWYNQMDYGACRVEAPRGQDSVVIYCAKYVLKERCELFISDSFQRASRIAVGTASYGESCGNSDSCGIADIACCLLRVARCVRSSTL